MNRDNFERDVFDHWLNNRYQFCNDDDFDDDGYNSKGFDCYGFDREGYNIHGWDCQGYYRSGWHYYGYHRFDLHLPIRQNLENS